MPSRIQLLSGLLTLTLLSAGVAMAQSPTNNFGPGLGHHPRRTINFRQVGEALFRPRTHQQLQKDVVDAENHLYGKSYPDESMTARIRRMEKTLFGREGEGDLALRLARIQKQIHDADITNTRADASEAMVEYLERKLFQRVHDEPMAARLTRLESHVFGKTFEHYPQDVRLKKLTYTIPLMAKEIRVSRDDGTLVATTRDRKSRKQPQAGPSKTQAVETPAGETIVTGDFLKHIHRRPDGRFLRWARLPMRVYCQNATEEQLARARAALTKWNQVFPMAMADSPYEADVLINWQPGISTRQSLIHPMLHLDEERSIRTVVSINMSDYAPDALQRGLLHQLGHAAGLWGHSPFPSDIMYPATALEYEDIPTQWRRRSPEPSKLFRDRMPEQPAPSPRDVNTLKGIYKRTGVDMSTHSPFR